MAARSRGTRTRVMRLPAVIERIVQAFAVMERPLRFPGKVNTVIWTTSCFVTIAWRGYSSGLALKSDTIGMVAAPGLDLGASAGDSSRTQGDGTSALRGSFR